MNGQGNMPPPQNCTPVPRHPVPLIPSFEQVFNPNPQIPNFMLSPHPPQFYAPRPPMDFGPPRNLNPQVPLNFAMDVNFPSNVNAPNNNGVAPNVPGNDNPNLSGSAKDVRHPLSPEIVIVNAGKTPVPTPQRSRANSVSSVSDSGIEMLVNELSAMRVTLDSLKSDIPALVKNEVARLNTPKNPSPPLSVAQNPISSYATVPYRPAENSKRLYGARKLSELIKFNGQLEPLHPKTFINNLKLYKEVNPCSDEVFVNEIQALLTNSALSWYQAYHANFKEKFCSEFLRYFWGDALQNKVRASIFMPNQFVNVGGSFANYFLENVKKLRLLDQPLPDSIMVSAVIAHFPPEVQWSLSQTAMDSVDTVLFTLQKLDNVNLQSQLLKRSSAASQQPSNLIAGKQYQQQKPSYTPKNVNIVEVGLPAQNFSIPPPSVQDETNPLN